MSEREVNTRLSGRYSGAGWILLQDVLLSLTGSLLAVLLVRWLSDPIPDFTALVLLWLFCALCASLLGNLLSGSHRVVRRWATVRSTARLLSSVAVKELCLVLVLFTRFVRFPSTELSALSILADSMLTLLFLLYIRFSVRLFSRSEITQVKAAAARRNAVVYGTGTPSVQLAAELSKDYNVVGFLTTDHNMAGRVISDIMVYYAAAPQDLEQLEWRLGGVDCVFFPRGEQLTQASDSQSTPSAVPEDVSRMSLISNAVKRGFDIMLSGVLMLLFLPLALLCAVAVKLEDGGPVLYRQERIGRGGKPFSILKFRSMRTDAEAGGAQLYAGEADPRLTRVGSFLRRHHLDELPQLWNVFRGDMSFIGYRPERSCFIEKIMARNPRYRYLYQIRPGVTSYATLYNGYTDTLDKMLTRLDLDLYYLRNQSLLFDAKVLGLTFLRIATGKEF